MPGQTMPNLMGSSMHQPSGRLSKPCHFSPGCSTQQLGSVDSCSADALWNGTFLPDFASVISSAFHGAKNQSFLERNSWRAFATARRQATASSMLSCVSDWPAGPSMMAAATSLDAISAYNGEVLAWAQYASLKRP